MAGVVGFVLILAAAMTYLSFVAQTDVPRWGAESERAWDADVGQDLGELAQAASAGVDSGAPVTGALPSPPEPRGLDVPFLIATKPIRPSGTIGFDASCGGVWANHTTASGVVADVADGAHGCLLFRLSPTYVEGSGYRAEFGGVLRVQGARAFVMTGPALELTNLSDHYAARLTLVGMEGSTASMGVDRAAVPISLVPQAIAADEGYDRNAAAASWTFTTPYPDAWREWFAGQILGASLDPALNYACTNDDARCGGLADDQVMVLLYGPSADPAEHDLSLGVSYARYNLGLG